ncbi:MAG TPA: hypothetical protein ENI26_03660 [Methylophaga aminisulfidivorans]|uniref:Chalcone isomerase domain-containing protein n=2 Tax=root TaxID=1 RepID=A0A7C2AAB1_9GAMM|nr:hypothetical protein [Methylophaga aminisulfidivorans]
MSLLRYTLIMCLSLPMSVSANEFEKFVKASDVTMNNCQQTSISVMAFINVADVGFFMPDCQQRPAYSGNKQLSFIYHRSIDAEDFVEAAETLIKRNVSADIYQQIEPDLNQFNSGYEDVDEGDRYDIRLITDELFLLKNNKILAKSNSALLGEMYFRIWFGEKPFKQDIKSKLLTPK